MTSSTQPAARDLESNRFPPFFWPTGAATVCLAYFVVIRLTNGHDLLQDLRGALANILSLAAVAATARLVIRRITMRHSFSVQVAIHLATAAAFACVWYWLLMVMLGLAEGISPTQFDVRPFFNNPAVKWQLMQGLTVYCLIAALSYLEIQPGRHQSQAERFIPASESVSSPAPLSTAVEPAMPRYFIKLKDDIRPVDVREIISIRGAGDYAEMCTAKGRYLTRMTLAEFESALKGERFIRVHRSIIVNLEQVTSIEPAGEGRLLLHMHNGDAVQSSKAGAKLLRKHVI